MFLLLIDFLRRLWDWGFACDCFITRNDNMVVSECFDRITTLWLLVPMIHQDSEMWRVLFELVKPLLRKCSLNDVVSRMVKKHNRPTHGNYD